MNERILLPMMIAILQTYAGDIWNGKGIRLSLQQMAWKQLSCGEVTIRV